MRLSWKACPAVDGAEQRLDEHVDISPGVRGGVSDLSRGSRTTEEGVI